jgi:hypothetical protein
MSAAETEVALRNLRQQRPNPSGFHGDVGVIQQAIEFVKLAGVLGLRHELFSLYGTRK